MKNLLPAIVSGIILSAGVAAASAGGEASSHRRIVMHGVDCLIENGSICAEEQPVLDEALSEVAPDAQVVVRPEVGSGRPTETTGEVLSPASVDAICEYLNDGGVDALSVDGDVIVPQSASDLQRIDVQLSHTTR